MFIKNKIPSTLNVTGKPVKSFAGVRRRLPLALVIILVLTLVVGAVIYQVQKSPSTPKSSVLPSVPQTYSETKKYTVTGSTAGAGMTFIKPNEFGSKELTSKLTASFIETSTNKKNETTPIGELAATATALSYPYSSYALESVNKSIMSATPSNTKPVESMLTFVSYYVDKGYTLKMTSVKQFKSSNIKANAWVVDITAAPTKAADADRLPPQAGRVLYALGQKGFYYFFAMTADYNWSSNQASWDKVFNSVAIDK